MTWACQRRVLSQISCIVAMAVSSCLAQGSKSASPVAPNPYDEKLAATIGRWAGRTNPEKLVLLERAFGLREYVNNPAQLTAELSRVANDSSESRLIRDEAQWRLARIALSEGRIEEARQQSNQLGFVTRWNLIGTGKCTADRLDDISHRTTLVSTPLAAVSIPGLEEEVCVATTIYSDVDRAVALRFSVAGTGSLYVNGGVAADSVGGTAVAFDQHSVGVRINAGWNVIALEVRGSANRQFALRVTHPGGEGIVVSSDPTRVHAATATAEQIAVADLLSEAEAKANAKKTPDAFDTLAEIADLRALADAADRRQTAALNAPTANRWLAVARECDEASCMFSALNKARQLDPQNANVLGDLADYYTERGQLEKSRDLLRQALAADPGNYVLAKRLADVNASAGSMTTALSEYRNLETSGIHSIWLERELGLRYEAAGLNDRATVLLNEAWRLSFDDESVRSALQQLAEAKGDSAELQKLARAAVALHPEDVTASFALAQLENSPAKFERAAASANANGDNDLRVRYANLLAFAGKPREASAELALAAQQDVRIQLPPTTSGTDPDSGYLENAAALAAKAQRTPPGGSANVVTLADVTVERMLASGQTSQHVQQVFYIATQRGARDYSNRTIQYSETSQRLTVASARVYTRDGRVISAEDEGESSVADTNISMYYDTRSRSFRFPSLQKGDVIELEYRISPRSNLNPYGSYFGSLVAFQGALPQQLHRYVLVAPASRKLKMVQERMPAAEVVTNNGETTYRWEMRDIAPLPNEPRGPSLTEIAPYLSVSTFTDWTQLGHWYAQMIAPQFALDAPLREALTQITKNAGTELEKVRAIHEFVVRNTHYVAMEFGIYSYKPYPVSQVYARRFGDCKDKASLMIALMRAAGIDAELALVRTRKLGDVSEQATNISVFNHAVAYIPKYDLWLDGTAEYAGFHELPLDDQGAMALTVNLNGATNLRRIPVTLPMQNYTHRVVRAEVQTDGKIVFNGSAYTRGEDAPGLRREYEVAERQRDTVRANLAQVYPSVQVDSVHVDGTHDLEHDIKVNFSGSLDTFAGKKSLDLAPSWLPHKYVNSLAPLTTRTEQLQLPAPWTTEEELHFTIPQDANLDRVPENWHYDTPFGTAVIRYELRGRELIVTTSVQFRKLRIEPTEYSGFRDFCRNVEKAFHQEIKVRLAS